jgi:predicted transcriptional regulator
MRSLLPCSGTAPSWRSDSISAMPRMNKGALERLQERIRTADRGWFFAAVADKVSERRQEIGLSQRELAELVGTTQSAIARLERGGRPPRIDTLLRIADALECDLVVDLKPRRH